MKLITKTAKLYRHFILGITFVVCLSTSFSLQGQDSLDTYLDKSGYYYGLNYGTWLPLGDNTLGNPHIFGVTFDFLGEKGGFGLSLFAFGYINKTPKRYSVMIVDSLYSGNKFNAAHVTLNFYRKFMEGDYYALEGLLAVGGGDISYFGDGVDETANKSTLVIAPGLSYRHTIGWDYFVQLKAQYHIADYALKDDLSTDFSGNFITTTLVLGKIASY